MDGALNVVSYSVDLGFAGGAAESGNSLNTAFVLYCVL